MENSTNNILISCSWCEYKTKIRNSELNNHTCNKCGKKTTQLECPKCNYSFIEVYSKVGKPYKCANCNEIIIPKVWISGEQKATPDTEQLDISTKVFLIIWIFSMLFGALIILS